MKILFFKNSYHEELYKKFISKLNNNDIYYTGFAYVAAATQKKDILSALNDHSVDYELLFEISKPWSRSEKAMLEGAWQMFNGSNLYDEDDQIQFPNIRALFESLDPDNSRILVEAITRKHL